MKTIGQVLRLSYEYLQTQKSPFGRLEVEWLIAGVLNMNRLDLYLNYDRPLQDEELDLIRTRLRRLAKGEPLQYIEGKVVFHGCLLSVDRRVLIPRPETELLVELALERIQKPNLTLVDVCTGSGCIGIACKKKAPFPIDVWLLDISEEALSVAKENAKKNEADVKILKSDLLAAFPDSSIDILVSNPPYVSEQEYQELEVHVREFEPKIALVGGATGIEMYERLAVQIPKKLRPGGVVLLEIGANQKEPLEKLFKRHGFTNTIFSKDLSNNSRFMILDPFE
jgi:release factor glutamine methyltransferase